LESDNSPVITDLPDFECVYSNLESSLLEAQIISERWQLGWEKCFAEAASIMQNHSPALPYYKDLIPDGIENIKIRQLLAGALQAWVFGGLGSWNDMYISDPSLEKEYQRISRRLYVAVIQTFITQPTQQLIIE